MSQYGASVKQCEIGTGECPVIIEGSMRGYVVCASYGGADPGVTWGQSVYVNSYSPAQETFEEFVKHLNNTNG